MKPSLTRTRDSAQKYILVELEEIDYLLKEHETVKRSTVLSVSCINVDSVVSNEEFVTFLSKPPLVHGICEQERMEISSLLDQIEGQRTRFLEIASSHRTPATGAGDSDVDTSFMTALVRMKAYYAMLESLKQGATDFSAVDGIRSIP